MSDSKNGNWATATTAQKAAVNEAWRRRSVDHCAAATGSVDLLTNRKTASIITDRDYHITGYVLTSANGQYSCVVDRAAVRWLTSAEWWELMHPASDDPAPNNQSEPRAAQNNQHE